VGLKKKQLGRDERIVVQVRGHRGALLFPLIVTVLGTSAVFAASVDHHLTQASAIKVAGLVIGLLGVALFIVRFFRWRAREITITNQRVVVSVGGVGPRRDQVSLDRIVEVQVDQRLRDRLIGRANLILELVDGPAVIIPDLAKAEALRRVLMRSARPEMGDESWAEFDDDPPHDSSEAAFDWPMAEADATSSDPEFILPMLVTEFDPTPPHGTPAISASRNQDRISRISEIDALEAAGIISAAEAREQRQRIMGRLRP
jgi:membrane protein YdbS with pleckstrin-like domain